MDFTIKSIENMEIPILGNIAQKYSITCQSEPLLMEKLSVFTVGSVLKSRPSIKSELLTEKYKFLTKDRFVTLCGQILRISKIGPSMLEEQGGFSVRK
jgi:hypothetical protein